MLEWFNIFWESTIGVFDFYKRNLFFETSWSQNYLWGLLLISLIVWGLEILFPWRKSHACELDGGEAGDELDLDVDQIHQLVPNRGVLLELHSTVGLQIEPVVRRP